MVSIALLWLPIVVAALVVFFASFLAWTVLPHHKPDWGRLPGEEVVMKALRDSGVTRGQYVFPYAGDMKAMKDPEFVKRIHQGPIGFLVVGRPGPPAMAKQLAFSLVYNLVVSLLVAYLASRTLAAGTAYLQVFRVAGTIAVLAYSTAVIPGAVWFSRTWSSTWKEVADGVVYGLLTGGVFGWLWPG